MRKPSSLITLLAVLPALALAQTAPVAATSGPQNEPRPQKALPKPADTAAVTVHTQERSPAADAASALKEWAPPKWDAPVEQRLPKLTLGGGDAVVSGPLVDTFRVPRYRDTSRSLGERILSLPIINIFVPEPMPRPSRQGAYFAWGERNDPWATVSARPQQGPVGVLVSVRM